MKNYIYILMFLFSLNLFSQTKKEIVYLLFNSNNKEKCKIDVEQTYKNKKGIEFVQKYRKEEKRKGFIDFYICDERFVFNKVKNERDTCTVKSLNKTRNIEYLLGKYEKSNKFKHLVFKKIFIVEKTPKNKIIKYEVYWSGEWTIK